MAADVPGGGSSSTRLVDHLLPLPRTGERCEPTPASSRRPNAAEGAACRADDAEIGKKMVPAADATDGRRGHHPRRSSSPCGTRTAPLATRHHPASPPVNSLGGGNGRKNHGSDDDDSFLKPGLDDEKERLSANAFSLKPPSIQRNIRPQATGYPDKRGAVDVTSKWGLPKVCEKEDEESDHDIYSASNDACEDRNSSADFEKPCLMPGSIRIVLQKSKPRPLLDFAFADECSKEYARGAASRTPAGASSDKDTSRCKDHIARDRLGYGDPHPPPFFKCEVCIRRTAFYHFKCCKLIVCEVCGCGCDPDDLAEDKSRQSQVGKKEKLPKVKLEGSNLFLWRSFNFPSKLILCMAKRTGNKLCYYFASRDDLMNGECKKLPVTVYNFTDGGSSWYESSELISRAQFL